MYIKGKQLSKLYQKSVKIIEPFDSKSRGTRINVKCSIIMLSSESCEVEVMMVGTYCLRTSIFLESVPVC